MILGLVGYCGMAYLFKELYLHTNISKISRDMYFGDDVSLEDVVTIGSSLVPIVPPENQNSAPQESSFIPGNLGADTLEVNFGSTKVGQHGCFS